jgi:hypothetical protein
VSKFARITARSAARALAAERGKSVLFSKWPVVGKVKAELVAGEVKIVMHNTGEQLAIVEGEIP